MIIDLIDRKILSELDKNARTPISDIAKTIKKSKQLINYRMKNLEEQGLILGYNAVIDYSKLGFISFRVYINLKTITPEKQKEFVDFLKEQKEIWWLVSVENICDIAYAVFAKDIYDFYKHLDKISKFNKCIKSKEIVIYSNIKQYPKSYLLNNTQRSLEIKKFMIGFSSKKEDFDNIDLKLLEIIGKNARLQLISIASKLDMKPQSVVYRIKKLEEKQIIKGYRANINIGLLGFKNYKIYLHLLDNSRIKEIEAFFEINPFVVTTNKTIGSADFEIELQLEDINQLYKILDAMRKNFSDIIESYEYGVAREEIKMIYIPNFE